MSVITKLTGLFRSRDKPENAAVSREIKQLERQQALELNKDVIL